ncbi:hypothetical protein NLI96_g7151 [Meripilus lineatus]|uniref:F-box domain-containing protein n=1 Tax=Meripilus lineatus TaxID=2056292 RepID=A0AAD5V1G5_9APHY|nr:hypothetical protein NLI96_g7151 [Physisporinus lineatus]
MDKCPLEIYLDIFALACTDDGQTGCSLSLVSKAFADISRPVQLRSVALYGSSQISKFVSMLEKRDPRDRKVRNLFVCQTFTGAGEVYPTKVQQRIISPFPEKDCHNAVFPLLFLTAPYLSILSLAPHMPTSVELISKLAEIDFPQLTELTLNSSTGAINSFLNDFHPIPTLKRLQLTASIMPHVMPNFPRLLSRTCPNLSHLYLLPVHDADIPRDFLISIGQHIANMQYSVTRKGDLPTTLKLLILDRQVPSRCGTTKTGVRPPPPPLHQTAKELYELVERAPDFLRVNVVCGPKFTRSAQAHWWWANRVTGGEGCWLRARARVPTPQKKL